MSFSLGCAVWAYKEWVGDLFPKGSRSTDFLRLYSRRFTTVEGNTTFYSIPDADTVQRWATETPEGFEFCLKLPRDLTHRGLLTPAIAGTQDFLARMQGLGSRLGPSFAQLPPSYGPAQFADLEVFLRAWSSPAGLALEVRHPDWFAEPHASRLTELLRELGIGRVLLDSRPIYDEPDEIKLDYERRKPKLPLDLTVTAPFSLIRYISNPQQALNQSFLEEWVRRIDGWLRQGTRIYFFVHCPIEARSPSNARYVQQMLEAQGVAVPPLPWDRLEQPPAQLNLFGNL
jgi:uncharacterized protein YecE (DUF72 family)